MAKESLTINAALLLLIIIAVSIAIPALTSAETFTFTYDKLNRLKSATYSSSQILYTYDSNGNLLRVYSPDSIPPVIDQVTPVPTPTKNQNPSYTFSSTEKGIITYGGTCTSATTSAVTGSNTIILTPVGGGIFPEGSYINCTITVTDSHGNVSSALTVDSFIVDTTPPSLLISTLDDNAWTSNQTLNVSGTATDNNGVKQLSINATTVTLNPDGNFSHAIQLVEGTNVVTTIAEDLAGNQTTDTRTINYDPNAPVISISTPADNSKTKTSPVTISGTVNETSTVGITINGNPLTVQRNGNDFTATVPLDYDLNTIMVTATDSANNTSTAKRSVTYDNLGPSVAITDPGQDIRTNQSGYLVKGTATDLTTVTVTMMVGTDIYNPPVTNGSFELQLSFTAQQTYNITIIGQDELGNLSIAQRNIVYDITEPSLTIDSVASPIRQSSQTVTGTVEAGATVSVATDTAALDGPAAVTGTTWSYTIKGLVEGQNGITVTATDAAGNSQTATTSILLDTISPTDGILTATPGDTEVTLNWTSASDAGSGLVSATPYKLVKAQGTTPPNDCLGTAIYLGSALTYPDAGLTDGLTYSYRLCAYDNAGNVSVGVTATATAQLLEYPLTVTQAGSGTGTVWMLSGQGVVAVPGFGSYPKNTPLTLHGVADTCSTNSGFSGSCNSNSIDGKTSDCSFIMTGPMDVTATFNLTSKVMNFMSLRPDDLLQDALGAAGTGHVIGVQAFDTGEAIIMDRPVVLLLQGGYDCDFYDVIPGGMTRLRSLTITDGALFLENIEISGP